MHVTRSWDSSPPLCHLNLMHRLLHITKCNLIISPSWSPSITALVTAGLMVTPCLWEHEAPLNLLVAANTCLQLQTHYPAYTKHFYPACSNKHYLYQPPLTLLVATNISLRANFLLAPASTQLCVAPNGSLLSCYVNCKLGLHWAHFVFAHANTAF